jgi:hypothetical protein
MRDNFTSDLAFPKSDPHLDLWSVTSLRRDLEGRRRHPACATAARGASALVPNVRRQSKHESFQEVPQVLWHWRNDERNGIEDLGTVFTGGFAKPSKGAEHS